MQIKMKKEKAMDKHKLIPCLKIFSVLALTTQY